MDGEEFLGTPDQCAKLKAWVRENPKFSTRTNKQITLHLSTDRAEKLDRLVEYRRQKHGFRHSSQRLVIEEALDRMFAFKFDD